MPGELDARDAALRDLLGALKARGYRFVTPSPRSHANVLARPAPAQPGGGDPLRQLLGWSRPADPASLPADILALLHAGGALAGEAGAVRSLYRVSSDGDALYLHSAYPTTATDSVFFGPDSYRFAAFIRRNLPARVTRLAEIGAGSGVGALTAAHHFRYAKVTMTDINPAALRLARINAAALGVDVRLVETSGLTDVTDRFDLIVANPPYLVDADKRAYRHGGGQYGAEVALAWAEDALSRLNAGGRLLLYSGAPVVAGEDLFLTGLRRIAAHFGAALDYEEIDPDVWGEELARPDYADVERIAVGGAALSL